MATTSSVTDRVRDLFSSFLSNVENDSNNSSEADTISEGIIPNIPDRVSISPKEQAERKCTNAARNKMLYYDRVETYSALTWFAKPHDLSPLVCARYGWENVDTDMLQCVHCKAFLCGQLPKAVDTQNYKESCSKLRKHLINSHEKLCTWSTNPCPELFSRVPYHHQGELLTDFRHRLVSLQCSNTKLPSVTYTSLLEQDLTKDKVEISAEEILKRAAVPDLDNVQPDVVLFAVCGWTYSEGQIDILQCSYCRRKVGLWNYGLTSTSKDTDEKDSPSHSPQSGSSGTTQDGGSNNKRSAHTSSDEEEQPARKRTKIEKQSFDPIAEHRYWCPWLQQTTLPLVGRHWTKTTPDSSPSKQTPPSTPPGRSPGLQAYPAEAGSRVPAWLLVMKMLSHDGDVEMEEFCCQMKQSPQVEGLRHLRKVLRDCTSPTSPSKQQSEKV